MLSSSLLNAAYQELLFMGKSFQVRVIRFSKDIVDYFSILTSERLQLCILENRWLGRDVVKEYKIMNALEKIFFFLMSPDRCSKKLRGEEWRQIKGMSFLTHHVIKL